MGTKPTIDDEYEDSEIIVDEPEVLDDLSDQTEVDSDSSSNPEPAPTKTVRRKTSRRKLLGSNGGKVIELPKHEYEESGYVSRCLGRIDMQLKGKQRTAFRAIYAGLRESGATLENGKLVDSPSDVVRWIFEQASEPND
ncbi:MAG: hypothetical protein KDA77_00125 [Planctomycetaceae bacterium]|nr:hypothetical protein [Planctomycetaceae bacterium]